MNALQRMLRGAMTGVTGSLAGNIGAAQEAERQRAARNKAYLDFLLGQSEIEKNKAVAQHYLTPAPATLPGLDEIKAGLWQKGDIGGLKTLEGILNPIKPEPDRYITGSPSGVYTPTPGGGLTPLIPPTVKEPEPISSTELNDVQQLAIIDAGGQALFDQMPQNERYALMNDRGRNLYGNRWRDITPPKIIPARRRSLLGIPGTDWLIPDQPPQFDFGGQGSRPASVLIPGTAVSQDTSTMSKMPTRQDPLTAIRAEYRAKGLTDAEIDEELKKLGY